MQQYNNQYSQKQYSTLAKSGKAILESNVKPFYLDHQHPPHHSPSPPLSYPRIVHASFNPTALVQKLTLKRLRKMQALVRGFLTRRITYPRLLKRYKICQKIFQSISHSCILEESSSIVLELVSQNKHTKQLSYESKEDKVVFGVMGKVMQEMVQEMTKEVIATCISEGIARKKPEIKVGVAENKMLFRMDIPEQRTAKKVIFNYIDKIRQDMAKQVIKEVVGELRIEKIAEEYILKQVLLPQMVEQVYREYVNQILLEEISNRVIDDSMEEFSQVLVKYEAQKHRAKIEEMGVRESQTALFELMIGEEIMGMICEQLVDE